MGGVLQTSANVRAQQITNFTKYRIESLRPYTPHTPNGGPHDIETEF